MFHTKIVEKIKTHVFMLFPKIKPFVR